MFFFDSNKFKKSLEERNQNNRLRRRLLIEPPRFEAPTVGDKKLNGSFYTEDDIELLRKGFQNMNEAFQGLMKIGEIKKQRNKLKSNTMQKLILGIDPGTNGALATIKEDGTVITYKMPETPKDLYDLLKTIKIGYDVDCMLEKVGGMPKMGGSSMFNFGKGYGHLEMALIALEIKTTLTSPQAWQKTYMIGTKSKLSTTEWKNKLKALAQQLFPRQKVTLGNADALLIMEYSRKLNK